MTFDLTALADSQTDVAGIQMPTVALWIIGLAALAGAVRSLWTKVVKPVVTGMRTIHKTYEKVMDYDTRLGNVERLSMQLENNSGSSLRDAIDRIEEAQKRDALALQHFVDFGRDEVLKIWQNLASRDAVEAAARTAEMMERKEKRINERGEQDSDTIRP